MSQDQEWHDSAVVNGKLYVFGGYVRNSYSSLEVEVYSPASDAADLPFKGPSNITAVALRAKGPPDW